VSFEVRPARRDEYDEAGRVTARAYREFAPRGESVWREYLEQIGDVVGRAGRALVLVAVDGRAILGTATLELGERIDAEDPPLERDEAHVRMLGVDPPARGRGIARALMAECAARAARAGRGRLTLHTTHRMRAAQRMYEAMGFRRRADRVLPDGFVLLSYEKQLDLERR
jgi:ribosomal protein S18 acetylase RimI-like enzyme